MHTLIPIVLLPYLQCVAITETKGSLDELVTFNYMYIAYIQSTSNTEHFLRRDLWVTVDYKNQNKQILKRSTYLIEISPQRQINCTCNEILRNQLIRNIVM
jgi:hypothetical protein